MVPKDTEKSFYPDGPWCVTIISTAKYQNCGGPLQNFGQTFGPSLFQNYARPLVPLIQWCKNCCKTKIDTFIFSYACTEISSF